MVSFSAPPMTTSISDPVVITSSPPISVAGCDCPDSVRSVVTDSRTPVLSKTAKALSPVTISLSESEARLLWVSMRSLSVPPNTMSFPFPVYIISRPPIAGSQLVAVEMCPSSMKITSPLSPRTMSRSDSSSEYVVIVSSAEPPRMISVPSSVLITSSPPIDGAIVWIDRSMPMWESSFKLSKSLLNVATPLSPRTMSLPCSVFTTSPLIPPSTTSGPPPVSIISGPPIAASTDSI